jgi:proteasome lid subunit RPN8/RPN11
MEPQPELRILPPDMPQPLTTSLPVNKASRWNSPYDRAGLNPVASVFMTQPAYSRICVHSVSDMRNEVGGILVGQWCMDENTREQFVVVEHALPARHTRQGSVYLTFTQDSLIDIHDQIDKNHKGQVIVGWYHTHPRMGIFLSHYDTWLHSHFFPEKWQVALVVEPYASLGGFFVRQKDNAFDPTRYFGFYELDGSFGRSMVNWTNLVQFEESEGESPHE